MKRKLALFLTVLCLIAALFACSERPQQAGFTVRYETFTGHFIPDAVAVAIEVAPEPKRTGYVFEGWYEDEAFSEAKRVKFPFYPEHDTVLYAKYIDLNVGNDEITYTLADGGNGYEAAAYSGFSANVVIPQTRNGLPVTAVQVGFLKNASYLQRFYFYSLENIEEIFYYSYGFEAFVLLGDGGNYSVRDGVLYDASCETLLSYPIAKLDGADRQTQFDLPQTVKRIAKNAFRNAIYLEEITFGGNVSAIEENFRSLSSLKRLTASDNPNFYTEDGVLYSGDRKRLLSCPISVEKEVYTLLPDTEEVVEEAFEKCKVKQIIFNESLKKFGLHAQLDYLRAFSVPKENTEYFSEDGVLYSSDGELIKYPACKENEEFKLSDKTVSICAFAFNGTERLKKVRVNSQLQTVSAYAFGGGSGAGLSVMTIEEESKLTAISEDAFVDCGNVTLEILCRVPPEFTGNLPANIKSIVVPLNLVGLYLALYPQFEDILTSTENGVIPYKVTFNSNGGSEIGEMICTYVATEPKPTKEGYIFGGWYADENCATAKIAFPIAVTEDTELYALWLSE